MRPVFWLSRRAFAIGVVVAAAWLIGVDAAWQRPKLEQSVDLLIPTPPVIVNISGTPHLVYELHITNMRGQPLALRRVRVSASPSGETIEDLVGAALTRALQRVGAPRNAPEPEVIAPGQRTVTFLWIALSGRRPPETVSHHLELEVIGAEAGARTAVEGRLASVATTEAEPLGPPLSGGPWVAIYDPSLMGGHRTAIYTLEGKARIPGRFAIDLIRAPGLDSTGSPAPTDPSVRNGFGSDVLAVADARVASVVDDMPDNPPDAAAASGPLPIEQGSGNYVVLDLGHGRFAFYEHLRHKSILVQTGERVRTGQVIAQLGNSGSTSAGPHLHFHVADANATLAAEGQPFVFHRFEHLGAYRSLEALFAGEPWIPRAPGEPRLRRLQHPAPVAVIVF